MEIPKYDECRLKEPEERTPLDNFVLYYAPTGREGLFAKNLIKLLEWVASQSGVENDRSSNCSVCGKELKLICKKCATPPVSTTAAV